MRSDLLKIYNKHNLKSMKIYRTFWVKLINPELRCQLRWLEHCSILYDQMIKKSRQKMQMKLFHEDELCIDCNVKDPFSFNKENQNINLWDVDDTPNSYLIKSSLLVAPFQMSCFILLHPYKPTSILLFSVVMSSTNFQLVPKISLES